MNTKSKNPIWDCLKYWRVIRQFIKLKYGLTQSDLDIILFLNSEGHFSKDKFREFERVVSWDKYRFERLRKEGWIEVFRERKGRFKALYQLSHKSKQVVISIYKKLSGEEIPMSPSQNPIFLKNVSYATSQYRKAIENMNAAIKQQRHHAPE